MSRETIPVLKGALVELNLGRSALKIYVFVAEITDMFILGPDVLRICDVSMDLGRHMLRLGREVLLWRPGGRPRSSRLTLASDKVIPAKCETVVTAWQEGLLKAA
jgi:hypothetical protein